MKADVEIVVREPERIIPAVTERQYVLRLSEHEARVLRALYGKAPPSAGLGFMEPLDALFPGDHRISYAGISRVRIETEEGEEQ